MLRGLITEKAVCLFWRKGQSPKAGEHTRANLITFSDFMNFEIFKKSKFSKFQIFENRQQQGREEQKKHTVINIWNLSSRYTEDTGMVHRGED